MKFYPYVRLMHYSGFSNRIRVRDGYFSEVHQYFLYVYGKYRMFQRSSVQSILFTIELYNRCIINLCGYCLIADCVANSLRKNGKTQCRKIVELTYTHEREKRLENGQMKYTP